MRSTPLSAAFLISWLLAPFLLVAETQAGGYVHNLYLCDLGITNPDRSNSRGVDYVQYTQAGRPFMIRATPNLESASAQAPSQFLGYDRWNPSFGIDEVSFNLESEFYGSQYFLEYCYLWNRQVPLDAIQYSILFTANLPVAVPYTQVNVDSRCATQSKTGAISESQFPDSPVVQNLLDPDRVSMRCTIRLTFKETSGTIPRPHNNDLGAVDPQIKVKVDP